MLDLAIKHEQKLKEKMIGRMFVEKYKFANVASYYDEVKLKQDWIGWNKFELVSVDKNGNIIGFFSADLCRDSFGISNVHIMNFTDDKIIFGRDLKEFFMKFVEREDIRKINFSVVIGNPIEKSYDKMIKTYGGRIVGIKEKDVKLFDGKFYDLKMYEIFTDKIREVLRKRMWRKTEI